MSIGSLFSFGFSIVSSMILSRYLVKEDYGAYKQVLYVYNSLLIVFTLGLPKAFSYFLPRVSIEESKNLINKLTNLFFLLGGVFSASLFLFSGIIANVLKSPELETALKIFSPVPLLMLPTMGLEGILSTFRKTQFLTVYTIFTRVMMLICVVLPVLLFSGGYIQAIVGFVVASFLSFILALYFKYLPVKHAGNKKCGVTYNEIFAFSTPLLFASLWGMLIQSADQFFISRYFGAKTFADFSNGSTELPFVGMIIGACSTVLSPVFSRLNHESFNPKEEIFPIWISVFEKSAKLIYPLLLYCWIFADVLMVVLYGDIYITSAIYFRIKLVVNFFTLAVYAPLIISVGKTRYYANVHMYGAIVLIILEYVSILIFRSPYFITVISVVCQIGRIFAMLYIVAKFFEVKVYHLFPMKLLLKIAAPSILILFLLHYLLVSLSFLGNIFILLIGFIAYMIIYALLSYTMKINYSQIFKPFMSRLSK